MNDQCSHNLDNEGNRMEFWFLNHSCIGEIVVQWFYEGSEAEYMEALKRRSSHTQILLACLMHLSDYVSL